MKPVVANKIPVKVSLASVMPIPFVLVADRDSNPLVMASASRHDALRKFTQEDLTTWHHDMALFSGTNYSGIKPSSR